MAKKVIIVGAGPCGLLLAHYLLHRDDKYQIDIYEYRNDPRIISFSTSRTFPISLNERGMSALRKIEGLEEATKAISLPMKGTIFHQKNGKGQATPRKIPLFTLDRTSLVILLLEKLCQNYDKSRLNIYFNCQCTQVNFVTNTVTFKKFLEKTTVETEEDFIANYDLLIGADGSRSKVREHFLGTELFECEQKYVPTDYKSVFLYNPDKNSHIKLERDKIHSWMYDNDTLMVLLYQLDGTMSGVILFPHQKNQVVTLTTTQEVLQFFQENFPQIGQLMTEEEAEAFLSRPISRILTIRCNRYHQGNNVLLMGDAAHAVSSSIGQGCNAALEDVVLFDNLLDEYSENFAETLEQFTVRRKQDAHALVELSDYAFPSTRGLLIQFIFRELFAKTMHQIFPKHFPPSLSELIFETTVSYSEILNFYQGWISKVKMSCN
jgi:kynurenine 3-monooxygenase